MVFASHVFRSIRIRAATISAVLVSLVFVGIGFTHWGSDREDSAMVPINQNWLPFTMEPIQAWYSWAYRDTENATSRQSENAKTAQNNTESMIKLWIGADYLVELQTQGREPDVGEQALLQSMIRYSDDNAAEIFYQAGGGDAVIERLISNADLSNTSVHSGWWSLTQMSAADAIAMFTHVERLSRSYPWVVWLLEQARNVDPSNAFGIPAGLPAGTIVTVKNGWTVHNGQWYLNCLAGWDTKVLAVLTRYPVELGQEYGAHICADIARQLQPSPT